MLGGGGFLPLETAKAGSTGSGKGPPHDSQHGKPTPPLLGDNCHLLLMSPLPFLCSLVPIPGGFQQWSKAQPLPPRGADVNARMPALLCSPAPPESSSPLLATFLHTDTTMLKDPRPPGMLLVMVVGWEKAAGSTAAGLHLF